MVQSAPIAGPAETADAAGVIEANRRRLDGLGALRRWTSPVTAGLDSALMRRLREHGTGALLDVGCGAMPYRDRLEGVFTEYDGLDIERRSPDVKYLASATDMACVAAESYDTVLCSEVLEHISRPEAALAELARVLRSGGTLVLSVPFLARLHEEPHDYYRYTRHGLQELLGRSGFTSIDIAAYGSVGSFVGHQVSTVALGTTWHVPVVRWVALALNALVVVLPARGLDRLLGRLTERFPVGYTVVARRAIEAAGDDAG
ncbi:MAG: class I SAM-dependent methyltransferase [Acidimicrobiia bacterium]